MTEHLKIGRQLFARLRASSVARRMVVVGLFGSVFLSGILISQFVDSKLEGFVRNRITELTVRHGLMIEIGSIESKFGHLTLGDISVGREGWLVIDHMDVSVSLNPLRSFLRPSNVSIGKVTSKIPLIRDLWPDELKDVLNYFSLGVKSGVPVNSNGFSSDMWVPQHVIIAAARVEIADVDTTKFLIENLSVIGDLKTRIFEFKVGRAFVDDLLEQTNLVGRISQKAAGAVFVRVGLDRGASSQHGWTMDCYYESQIAQCEVDAEELPGALTAPFKPALGTGFSPGFIGKLAIELKNSRESTEGILVALQGQVRNVIVEHPRLALVPVGPMHAKIDAKIRFTNTFDQLKAEFGKIIFLGAKGGPTEIESGVPLQLSLQLAKDSQEHRWTGAVEFDVPSTSCSAVLRVMPGSLVPELSGFVVSGDLALHGKIQVAQDGVDVTLKDSSFGCIVEKSPEIYTRDYLLGAFNIERETPDGKIMIPIDPKKPYFVPFADMPKVLLSSIISSEDSGFFSHQGIEMQAILGAAEKNADSGRALVGGSTITMQTVKNLFLARDKTIARKIQEMFLAWHLERTIPKERILEIYTNMVEFGPNLYGVGRASQRFFAKSLRDLTLKESVYLASLLPAPVPRYRYFCRGQLTPNYESLVRQLLERMLRLGKITNAEYNVANVEPIVFSETERSSSCGNPASGNEMSDDADEPMESL